MADSAAMRPFVQIAAVCQAALQEATGFLSIIRVIDRVPVQGFADKMPPQPLHNLCLAVVLKSGEMNGTYQLRIVACTPDHQRHQMLDTSVLFERDERGVVLIMPLALIVQEAGLYWFEVIIEPEEVLTRVPLRVMYQKVSMMPGMGLPPPPPPQSG